MGNYFQNKKQVSVPTHLHVCKCDCKCSTMTKYIDCICKCNIGEYKCNCCYYISNDRSLKPIIVDNCDF